MNGFVAIDGPAGSRTYAYYATRIDDAATDRAPAWRMPSHELESFVTTGVRTFLRDAMRVHDALEMVATGSDVLTACIADAAARAADPNPAACHALIKRINLHNDRIDIQVDVGLLLPPSFLAAASSAAAATHSRS